MSRKDPTVASNVFHCTPTSPFKGVGLKEGASVLHAHAHLNLRTGHRICDVCHTDLGKDYERGWQREERLEQARRAAAEQSRSTFATKVANRIAKKAEDTTKTA